MKLFVALLVASCCAAAMASEICSATSGKLLQQFAGKKYRMRFPCKYNAVRNQVCGAYSVTVSPTNALTVKGKYIITSLWLGLTEIATGKKWEGRTSVKIATKYLKEFKDVPFNTKFSSVGFTFATLFDVTPGTENYVEVKAKNGDFRVKFGVYDSILEHKASGFEFECYRGTTLNPYPDQICGNDTVKSIRNLRMDALAVQKPIEAILYDVFANPDNIVAQPYSDHCQRAENTLRSRCEGRQLEAIKYCWRIVGSPRHTNCFATDFHHAGEVFWHCLEFVCSNFEVEPFCPNLAAALDLCPDIYLLSDKVKQVCDPDLFTAEDPDMSESPIGP